MGFAYTPGILSIFTFVPLVGPLFWLLRFVWTLVAVTVAVRQALEFQGTGRAVLVVILTGIIGFIPLIIIAVIESLISRAVA